MKTSTELTCQICFEDKLSKDEFFQGLGGDCNHNRFCLGCVGEGLKSLINESKVMKIKCFEPECKRTFEDV